MNLNKLNISNLEIGDTLLYEKKGFIGRVIQFLTRSKFNHSSIKGIDGLIYEAIPPKYMKRTIYDSIGNNTIFVVIKRPKFKIDYELLDNDIKSMLNSKYEYLGLIFQLFHQLWGGWKGDREVTKNVYCSKSNSYLFMRQNVEDYKENWYKISPDEIFEDCKNFDTFELVLNSK